jgi:hypothetical protein
MKGGKSSLTENERINNALNGNYTPLINAIIRGNINEVRSVIQHGEVANQRDNTYNWCPLKWLDFVRFYGNRYSNEDYEELIRLLVENGSTSCYDDYHIRENSYNFSPVVLDIDEALEKIRKESEEDKEEDDYENNRTNTSGGRRRRKTRKIGKTRKTRKTRKSRKGKKSNKKGKRTTTKKRKHTKK